jgi:hypothetical protein
MPILSPYHNHIIIMRIITSNSLAYLLFFLFLLIVVTYDAVHVTTGWTTDNYMLFTEVSVIREID